MKKTTSDITIINVGCPLCGAADSHRLLEGLEDVEDRVPGHYAISRCVKCGLVYLSRRPSVESLPQCYPTHYHVHDPVRRTPIHQFLCGLRLQARYRHLMGIVGQKCNALLDVGCGDGSFLRLLDKKMPPETVLTGIDLRVSATGKAAGSRLNLIAGEFEKVEFSVKYDVVVMFHVLEHLAHPLTSLKKISEHLKRGGLLFGEVPNWDSLWRRLFPRHWQGLQIPRHQTLFDPLSLRKILNQAGYDVVDIRCMYDPGDLSVTLCNWIVHKLKLATPPRQVGFYFPAVLVSAPVVWLVNLLSRSSGTIEFVARKRS